MSEAAPAPSPSPHNRCQCVLIHAPLALVQCTLHQKLKGPSEAQQAVGGPRSHDHGFVLQASLFWVTNNTSPIEFGRLVPHEKNVWTCVFWERGHPLKPYISETLHSLIKLLVVAPCTSCSMCYSTHSRHDGSCSLYISQNKHPSKPKPSTYHVISNCYVSQKCCFAF